MSDRVEALNRFVVPPTELNYPEFVFKHQMDLEETKQKKSKKSILTKAKKAPAEQEDLSPSFDDLFVVITAMLNSSGGLIIVIPAASATGKDFDRWRNKMNDYLLTFVPPHILQTCIQIERVKEEVFITIRKSKGFITRRSHMYTRKNASNMQLRNAEEIVLVLTHQPVNTDVGSVLSNLNLSYLQTFTQEESANLEFKCYKCHDVKDLIDRLRDDRTRMALLAMGNLEQGGEMIIGVDDQSQVIGQPLDQSDEATFTEELSNLLSVNSDGSSCIWGTDTAPIKGKHWTCKFIQVTNHSEPLNITRQVIAIRINYCPGGVFVREPESYVLNSEGLIVKMSFQKWIYRSLVPSNEHKTLSQSSSVPISSDSLKYNKKQINLTIKIRQRVRDSLNSRFKDGVFMSYRKNSSSWVKDMGNILSLGQILTDPCQSIIFNVSHPINMTYSFKKAFAKSEQGHNEMLSKIKKYTKKKKAFGIQFSLADLCLSDLKCPKHLISDILTVTSEASIYLFSVFEKSDTQEGPSEQSAYSMILSRTLKSRLVECMGADGDVTRISVVGVTLTHQNGQLQDVTSPELEYYRKWLRSPNKENFQFVCSALYKMFDVKSSFMDIVGREKTVRFSQQQMETLFGMATHQNIFNIIEGPPGCGKTILAQHICKMVGEQNAVYFGTTRAFVKYIEYQGKIEAECVDDGNHLLKLISSKWREKCYYVLDDSHNLVCNKMIWDEIVKDIRKRERKCYLYVFQDSKFQHFQTLKKDHINFNQYLSKSHLDHFRKHLSVIHRNSHIVGSYLKRTAMDTAGSSKTDEIVIQNDIKGDDVIIRHIVDVAREGKDNGLLQHVKSLVSRERDPKHDYKLSDIVILLDNRDPEHLHTKVEFFRALFAREWPECNVQRSDTFPVKGLTIDSLDNFVGQERRVVLFILPKYQKSDVPERTIYTPQYVVAIAARGIDRVEFIHEDNIDLETAQQMKFDLLKPIEQKKSIIVDYPYANYASGDPENSGILRNRHSNNSSASDEHQRGAIHEKQFLKSSKTLNQRATKMYAIKQSMRFKSDVDGDFIGLYETFDTPATEPEHTVPSDVHQEASKKILADEDDIDGHYELYVNVSPRNVTSLPAESVSDTLDSEEYANVNISGAPNYQTWPRLNEESKVKSLMLCQAAKDGDLKSLQKFIREGRTINQLDEEGWSPISLAAIGGHVKAVTFLMSAGADQILGKQTALGAAAEAGQAKIVKYLLTKKLNVDMVDGDGMSPVAWASYYGHLDIIDLLLEAGADPYLGIRTALGASAGNGHLNTVSQLISAGHDVTSLDEDGWSAIAWAAAGGHTAVVKMLMTCGAHPDHGAYTALGAAAQSGHRDTVQLLLSRDVDVNAEDTFGKTALMRAEEKGHDSIVEILQEAGAICGNLPSSQV